jgi:hypothetical protein
VFIVCSFVETDVVSPLTDAIDAYSFLLDFNGLGGYASGWN